MKRRMGSYCSMGLEFPFRIIRVLQMDSEDGHPTVLICLISLSCTLKHDENAKFMLYVSYHKINKK